jgi:hypothetical protein
MAALLPARDLRSTLGKNIALVEEETGQSVWTTSPERAILMERETLEPPLEDAWRQP